MGPTDDKHLAALEKILAVSRQMMSVADLDELLGVIVQRSMELLEAERATLFLYDPAGNELVSRIAAGVAEIRVPATAGIAGAVATRRQTLNVPDAYADGRFNPDVDRKTGFRTRNILAAPLLDYSGDLVGVLQVLNKRGGAFDDNDVTLAETLAAQAGVVLQRARLLEHYVEKQRMEQSLAIARQIQQGLLPKDRPDIAGFDLAGWSSPADETGGDIYDYFSCGPGQWTIALADASGHGIGPALVVAEARAMLRALAGCRLPLPQALARVNDLLAADLESSRFVTCFVGQLDAAGGVLAWASAGHGPMVWYHAADERFEEFAATSLPLGVMEGADFDEQVECPLAPGDLFIIITDGIFEATSAAGEAFGMQRVRECFRRHRGRTSAEMIDALRAEWGAFTTGTGQADDVTAVVLRRLAAPA